MTTPKRIQLSRAKGWRKPEGAIVVARPTRWGNPFVYRSDRGLARADGARHDYHHPNGQVTVCHVRFMTRAEVVETYRRALTGDLTPSMRASSPSGRFLSITVADVVRDLAGHDLACWCPLDQPCHADVLLEIANGAPDGAA